MKRFMFASLAALACQLVVAQLVVAQPALYKDGMLTIPQGAVIDGSGSAYFESIQLRVLENGNFELVAAEQRSLAAVESLDVLVMESLPLQVSVSVAGYVPTPCNSLLTPAVAYKDNTFTVTLAYRELGPAETCIAVIEEYTTSVALDVAGLSAGTYKVVVNDQETEFTLQVDN